MLEKGAGERKREREEQVAERRSGSIARSGIKLMEGVLDGV